MGSLAGCLKKLGFTGLEADRITKSAEAYRKEGFGAEESNFRGVSDMLAELRDSEKNIYQQVHDGLKEDVRGQVFPETVKKSAPPIAPSMVGAVAGVQQDDQGNITYNPVLGAAGMAAGAAAIYGAGKFEGRGKKPFNPTTGETTAVTEWGRKEGINLNNLKVEAEAKQRISTAIDQIKPELEKLRGDKLTHEEVIQAAKESSLLRDATTKDQTKELAGQILRTRQHIAASEQTGKVTAEMFNSMKAVSATAADVGRLLNSFKIGADPEMGSIKEELLKRLAKINADTDAVVKAAEGVDFNDARQATAFYRQFVKPKVSEWLDEYRYINLLSSPKTHIVNAFSNLVQVGGMRPATLAASGAIDRLASILNKNYERQYYMRQVPAYAKGAANAIGKATVDAVQALKGKSILERPDLNRIPTGNKFFERTGMIYVPRALEAGDVFFRTLAEAGERESLVYKAKRQGITPSRKTIEKQAREEAARSIFRQPPDPTNKTGQGTLLSNIDKATQAVYALRKVPGFKWFVPFVRTPMNIFKQGIEYSPLGITTLPGSTRKVEQLAKASVGSMVFAGAGWLAMDGRTTWEAPTGAKEKAEFYAAGMQPYSVKIGNKWYAYSRLGPLAYPLAMAAAMRYYYADNPKALTQSQFDRVMGVMGGIASFFADQSYLQGIRNLVDAARDEEGTLAKAITSTFSQVIPMSSLQRWITQIVDPTYRHPRGGFNTEAMIEQIKSQIPGLSTDVEPYTTPTGQPSKREMPIVNAFSPVGVRTEQPAAAEVYRENQQQKQQENVERKDRQAFLDSNPDRTQIREAARTGLISRQKAKELLAVQGKSDTVKRFSKTQGLEAGWDFYRLATPEQQAEIGRLLRARAIAVITDKYTTPEDRARAREIERQLRTRTSRR